MMSFAHTNVYLVASIIIASTINCLRLTYVFGDNNPHLHSTIRRFLHSDLFNTQLTSRTDASEYTNKAIVYLYFFSAVSRLSITVLLGYFYGRGREFSRVIANLVKFIGILMLLSLTASLIPLMRVFLWTLKTEHISFHFRVLGVLNIGLILAELFVHTLLSRDFKYKKQNRFQG